MTVSDSTSEAPKSQKRPRTSFEGIRPFKRQRKATPVIQQVAKVFTECDYQIMGENKVWITKKLFDRIYPESEIEDHQYIKVAHYIYELGGLTDMEGFQIGVNEVQHLDLKDYLCPPNRFDSLQVRPYREEDINYREIKHILFKIKPYGFLQYQGRRKGAVKLSVEELRLTIKEPHDKGNIKDIWAFDKNTDIRLRSKKKGTINLVDRGEPVVVEKLTVKVEKAIMEVDMDKFREQRRHHII